MNTRQELYDMGLEDLAVNQILKMQQKHVGEMHGINKITDITYVGIGGNSVIELTCTACGAKRTKDFRRGRNKWNELAKTCSCQKRVLSEKEVAARKTYNSNPEFLGKIYGNQKVIEIISGSPVKWVCECVDCGSRKIVSPSLLKSGKQQCRCKDNGASQYIGKTYGRLTVLSTYVPEHGRRRFVCQCSCGNTYEGDARDIKRGKVQSCGCLPREIQEDAISRDPLYPTWSAMLSRCENQNNHAFSDYGGRGISVCEEWHDFKVFRDWCIENGYDPNGSLSLDRIDVNGNYEPGNCRYASIYVQNVNQRPRRPRKDSVTINGVTKTKAEWCKEYGIWSGTVNYRVKHMGMTFEEALVAEKQRVGNHNPVIRGMRKDDIERLNKINSYIECNLYMAFCRLTGDYVLLPQKQIDSYRVDFLVDGTQIVVECDGYDQHKTKEQMAADCKRERYLVAHGYTVIRFTGSEINGNPDGCAKELMEMILTLMENGKWQGQQTTRRTLKLS